MMAAEVERISKLEANYENLKEITKETKDRVVTGNEKLEAKIENVISQLGQKLDTLAEQLEKYAVSEATILSRLNTVETLVVNTEIKNQNTHEQMTSDILKNTDFRKRLIFISKYYKELFIGLLITSLAAIGGLAVGIINLADRFKN